jgi:hypothetical protein
VQLHGRVDLGEEGMEHHLRGLEVRRKLALDALLQRIPV